MMAMRKNPIFCFFLFLFLLVGMGNFSYLYGQSKKEYLYAGSFSEKGSKGIYVFKLHRPEDRLKMVQTVTLGKSPSFLALSPNKRNMYAVYESEGSVVSFKINLENVRLEKLNERSVRGSDATVYFP
jgi:6-phosphogluconolactonase